MKELIETTSPSTENIIQLSNTQTRQHNLIVCTRIHLPSIHSQNITQTRSEPNLSTYQCKCKDSKWNDHQNALLTSFILTSLQYCDHIAIAVEECAHCETQFHSLPSSIRRTIDKLSSSLSPPNSSSLMSINDRVTLIPIKYWGKFTTPLNILLNFAANLGFDRILYQSLEIRVNDIRAIDLLLNELKLSDTLIVGASFSDCHSFSVSYQKTEKKVELNGVTSPWNTFAIWNTAMLMRTGFLPISEGLIKGVHAGVEEVSVIALHQFIYSPALCQAKLIEINYQTGEAEEDKGEEDGIVPSKPTFNSLLTGISDEPIIEWITEGFDDDDMRKSWHSSKMSSKLMRAASQVTSLKLPPGEVIHKKLSLQK